MVVSASTNGHPGGCLEGSFEAGLLPDADAFRADALSSGGAFAGNYRSRLAAIAGWAVDVRALDVLPSAATIRFGSEGTNFFRSILPQLPSAGPWHRVFVPLDSTNGWSGPLAAFSNALLDVEFVEVQVVRDGSGPQRYALDNFELVLRVPSLAAFGTPEAPSFVTWTNLKAGALYEVQAAYPVTGAWSAVASFVATNSCTTWPMPPTNAVRQFLRILLPDPGL
jgi:hypothetical protein